MKRNGRPPKHDPELLSKTMRERKCSQTWAYVLLRRAELQRPEELPVSTSGPRWLHGSNKRFTEARVALQAAKRNLEEAREALTESPGDKNLEAVVLTCEALVAEAEAYKEQMRKEG